MDTVQGQAYHKKKAGMLSIREDTTPLKLKWKCIDTSASTPLVELVLDSIISLKATPATSDKMMLKIGMEGEKEVLFTFKSRVTMDEFKGTLQQIIARRKSAQAIDKDNNLPSASTNTVSSKSNSLEPNSINAADIENDELLAELLDSKKLLKNLVLQQRLLRENTQLMKIFTDAVIKEKMDAEEFWSSRVHLLRSFAIQNNQKKGPYNVLSTIKPVASSDNQVNVSVTREKITEIFKQYPIVRKAYDDNVPKMSEGEFWSRFFSSKLFRKLRGEKINLYDRGDVTLDKYLYFDPDYDGEEEDEEVDNLIEDKGDDRNKKRKNSMNIGENQLSLSKKKVKLFNDVDKPVSKCLDIEGNKDDDPELRGNKPDITMRDDQDPDLVNVLRTMNRLSRRMMSTIKEQQTFENMDSEFEKELELNDLDNRDEVEYNELQYTQRSNVASNIVPKEIIDKVLNQSSLNPTNCDYDSIIEKLKSEFEGELDLSVVYFQLKKTVWNAYKDVTNIVKKNTKQFQQSWSSGLKELAVGGVGTDDDIKSGLPKDKLENLKLTHSTSIEFLRQFWIHFNNVATSTMSTNPNFKSDLIKLRKCYFSLNKCLERVQSQLNSCIGTTYKEIEEKMVSPLIVSLKCALQKYEDSVVESK